MITARKSAALASNAHANLIKWAAVVALLEANLASTSSHGAANKVISIAKAERQKYLAQYDKYIQDIPA
jgi:hypothetical protein